MFLLTLFFVWKFALHRLVLFGVLAAHGWHLAVFFSALEKNSIIYYKKKEILYSTFQFVHVLIFFKFVFEFNSFQLVFEGLWNDFCVARIFSLLFFGQL